MRPARIAESSPRLFTAQPEPHVESRVPVLCPPRRAVPSHPRTSPDAAPRRSVGPCTNAAVWEPCWESQGTTTRKNHRAPISFFRLKHRGCETKAWVEISKWHQAAQSGELGESSRKRAANEVSAARRADAAGSCSPPAQRRGMAGLEGTSKLTQFQRPLRTALPRTRSDCPELCAPRSEPTELPAVPSQGACG